MHRATKIVATIGPAIDSDGADRAAGDRRRGRVSAQLLARHARIARRSDPQDSEAARRAERAVAVMQDLSGPKIRTGPLRDGKPIELREGESSLLASVASRAGPAGLDHLRGLPAVVGRGDTLLLDDGQIQLQGGAGHSRRDSDERRRRWTLGQHKGINAPGATFPSGATDREGRRGSRRSVSAPASTGSR